MGSFENIIKEIAKKSNLKEGEVLEKVYAKQEQYDNLISEMGAAYLVAKDLGVSIEEEKDKEEMKIKDLFPGINGLKIKAKILRIFPVTTFKRENGDGRVLNVIIADETQKTRLVLWDEQIDEFNFKEGDVIEIYNGYTRDRKDGSVEIRLGMYGVIRKLDEEISVPEHLLSTSKTYERVLLCEILEEDMNVEVKGYITKIFYKNPVVYFCKGCSKSVPDMRCAVHGDVEAFIVVSGILEDETQSIIFNLFDTALERFINVSKDEIIRLIEEKGQDHFYDILRGTIGYRYVVRGTTKKNKRTEEIELNVSYISEDNVVQSISEMIKELNGVGVEHV